MILQVRLKNSPETSLTARGENQEKIFMNLQGIQQLDGELRIANTERNAKQQMQVSSCVKS